MTTHRFAVLSTLLAALVLSPLSGWAAGAVRGDGYPRLMGMNIGAKNYQEPAYIDALSRMDLVILGFYPGWRGDRNGEKMSAVVRELKAQNPGIRVGQYTVLNESSDDPRKSANRDRIEKLNAENWWLRKADGSKAAWTGQYSAFDINSTEWTRPDRNGDRYPQWLAKNDNQQYFARVPFDVWYLDNVMVRSRVPKADWRQDGKDVSSTDADVQAAYRRGMAAHWAAARKLQPDLLLIGNVDSDLSSPEYRGQLNGAFLEGLMGKSWSLERRGWRVMMQRYLGVKANLREPAIVGFNVAGDPRDHRFFRYAFCSSLMGDGYFSFTDEAKDYSSVPWFDEYDVRLGKPVDPPQSSPRESGVYQRRYEHALVLVNPGDVPQQVSVGAGWRHVEGKQDASVNNGEPVTQLTLQPRDGVVLVKD